MKKPTLKEKISTFSKLYREKEHCEMWMQVNLKLMGLTTKITPAKKRNEVTKAISVI